MSQVALKPLGFGEILDAAFTLYRRNFTAFFLTALLPLVPVVLAWIGVMAASSGVAAADATAVYGATILLVLPYNFAASMLIWAALVHQTAAAYTADGDPGTGAGYRRAIRRVLPLVGASILAGILVIFGFILLIIPGFLVMIALFAVGPAVILEDAGPVQALERSWALAKGAFLRIGGIWLVAALIVTLPSMALMFVGGIWAAVAGTLGSVSAEAGMQVGSVLLSALTTPFMAACFTILYFDRRVRTEGYDVQEAISGLEAASGPAAEPLGA